MLVNFITLYQVLVSCRMTSEETRNSSGLFSLVPASDIILSKQEEETEESWFYKCNKSD